MGGEGKEWCWLGVEVELADGIGGGGGGGERKQSEGRKHCLAERVRLLTRLPRFWVVNTEWTCVLFCTAQL